MYYTSKTKDVDAIKSLLPKKKQHGVVFCFFPPRGKPQGP